MKLLPVLLMSLVAFNASASFRTNNWQDEISDTKVYTKYTSVKSSGYDNYQYFGFECRIVDGKSTGIVSLQFDGSEAVGTPNSEVQIAMRVDKGEVYDLVGRTYNNSYRSGYIRTVPASLYSELKTGSKLHMKLYNGRRLEVSETFSLAGSTSAINFVSNKCGLVVGESDDLVAKKKEINEFYDNEIAKLNVERKSKLAALK